MGLNRKTKVALVALGVVLAVVGPAVLVGAEAFLSGFYTTSGNIHHNATNGPEVIQSKDYNLRSGNPFTDSSYNLSTENNGWLNVSSTGGGPVVQVDEINGTWTNVSSVSGVGTHNITLQPSDKNFTRIGGGIDSFKYKEAKVDDGEVDVIYSASSTATIVVETNATDGTQYGLVDPDTDEGLDVGVADSNGVVAFTDVPTGTAQEARIQELGSLFIREETEPHELVTGSNATVTFYEVDDEDGPTIVQRSDDDDDGEIPMTGLPVTEQFAVRVTAPDHYNRTVLIDDLAQQETVFLLNQTETADTIDFSIEDVTGQFTTEESEIVVQRAINKSHYDTGGLTWLAIAGDRTGAANQLSVDLQTGVRYRLRVSDGDGDVRIVGGYTTAGDDAVTLRPAAPGINVTDIDTYEWNATHQNTSAGDQIVFEFADPDDATTDMTVQIYEQGNKSNAFTNQTVSGPLGYVKLTQSLTEEQAEKNWVVEWDATRNDGTISDKAFVSQSTIEQITALVPWVRHAIAALVIILVAGLFSVVNAETGAVATTFVGGGFLYVGWLPVEAAGAVAVALFVVLGWKVASRRLS